MSVRGLLAALVGLALSLGSLSAGEAPKAADTKDKEGAAPAAKAAAPPKAEPPAAPAPPKAEPPAAPAPAKPPAAPAPAKDKAAPKTGETAAQRAGRLGKLYDQAELLRKDGLLREAYALYGKVYLEDSGFRRVASQLRDLRAGLDAEDRHDKQAQVRGLLDAADAHFAGGNYEAAAKACENVLAIDERNPRAQRRLAECAAELELRRRVATIFTNIPGGRDRELLAQAKTAVDGKPPAAEEAPPKDAAPVVRPKEAAPAPPRAGRVVKPGENIEAGPPAPAAVKGGAGRAMDPEGSRLIMEAWDLCQAAKDAPDPTPALRKATDILASITPMSRYSQQTKDTASLLRTIIARRLSDKGRVLSPDEARRVRLYQRFAQAEERFRAKRYTDALAITDEILAEDKTFSLARNLNQEARIRQAGAEALEQEIEAEIALDRRFAAIAKESTPPDEPAAIARPAIHVKRPTAEIASPELDEKLNQRISVNLIAADLDYVLDLLFRSTGVNIIYNPDVVKGKQITIHVSNYPLSQLLDYIAANHGLTFAKTQDGVLITTPDQPRLETFVVPLRYGLLDVEKPPPTGSKIDKDAGVKPLDPEQDSNLERLVKQFPSLTEWPQGSFTYLDRQMNTLYIRTTREVFGKCLELLDAVDRIAPMVLIKALFIEIDANDFESYGVEASLSARQITTTTTDAQGNTTTTTKDDPDSHMTGKFSFPAAGFPKGETAGNLTFAGVVGHDQYKLTLTALQRMGRARILSAPNIICTNNCTAAIAVTTTLIYIEDYEVDRSDISGTSVGNPYQYVNPNLPPNQQMYQQPLSSEPILIPKFSKDEYEGFIFDVTASIGQDTRYITLSLNPRIRTKIDEVSFEVVLPQTTQTQVGGAAAAAAPSTPQKVTIVRPILDERSLSTKLTVADGSVVVLGGLLSHNKTAVRTKIPILGDVPILGWFFTKKSYTDDRRNLLMFVECQVITPTGAHYADSGHIDEQAAAAKEEPHVGLRDDKAPAVRPGP